MNRENPPQIMRRSSNKYFCIIYGIMIQNIRFFIERKCLNGHNLKQSALYFFVGHNTMVEGQNSRASYTKVVIFIAYIIYLSCHQVSSYIILNNTNRVSHFILFLGCHHCVPLCTHLTTLSSVANICGLSHGTNNDCRY